MSISPAILRTKSGAWTHLENSARPGRTVCGVTASDALPLSAGVSCHRCRRHVSRFTEDAIIRAQSVERQQTIDAETRDDASVL